MNTRYFKIPLHVILGGLAALFLSSTFAADSSQHKIVEGVAIYIGVIPAELIKGYPKAHPESEMHGGVPVSEAQYHIVLALFDAKTVARITNAKVTTKLSDSGVQAAKKTLEPMLIANTISYGNYFQLSGQGEHRIQIEISGVHTGQTIHATFEHART
jgi:hypothetical protein